METSLFSAAVGMDQYKQPVEKLGLQAVQKGPNARRARNRRAEAYLLIRWSEAIEAQRSRWAFFNSL